MILLWMWSFVFHYLHMTSDMWFSFPLAMTALLTAGWEFIIEISYAVKWLERK